MPLFVFEFNITKIAFHDVLAAKNLIFIARAKSSYNYKILDASAETKIIKNEIFQLTLSEPLWVLEFRLVSARNLLFTQICDKFPIVKLFGFYSIFSFQEIKCLDVKLIKRELYITVSAPFNLSVASFLCFEYISEYYTQNRQLRIVETAGSTIEWVLTDEFPEHGCISLGILRDNVFLELFREPCSILQNFVIQQHPRTYPLETASLIDKLADEHTSYALYDLSQNWVLKHPVWRYSANRERSPLVVNAQDQGVENALSFVVIGNELDISGLCSPPPDEFSPADGSLMKFRVLDVLYNDNSVPFIAATDISNPFSQFNSSCSRQTLSTQQLDVFAVGIHQSIDFPRIYNATNEVFDFAAPPFIIKMLVLSTAYKVHRTRMLTYTVVFSKCTSAIAFQEYIGHFAALNLGVLTSLAIVQRSQEIVFKVRCSKDQIADYSETLHVGRCAETRKNVRRIVRDLTEKLYLQPSSTEISILEEAFMKCCGFDLEGGKIMVSGDRRAIVTVNPISTSESQFFLEEMDPRLLVDKRHLWRVRTHAGGSIGWNSK